MGKIIRRILTIIPAVALQSLWLLLLMKWLTPYAPIIVSLLSVAAFFLVVFIIIKRDETAYKLLWLLVILSLPLVGALLYLLFGNKRTARPLKRRLQQVQKSCNPQPLPIKEAPFDGEKRMGQTVRWLEEKTQYPMCAVEQVRYYPLGDNMFPDMLADLKNARNSIYVEYFIIEPGHMWDAIVNELEVKMEQGVDVRVIYDDLGSISSFNFSNVRELKKKGIPCIPFNPFLALKGTANYRDHRKMLIIDNEVAYSGGINLSDRYINLEHPYGHWKDTGFRITGEPVKNFTHMFLTFWNAFSLEKEAGQLAMPTYPKRYPAPPHTFDFFVDVPAFRRMMYFVIVTYTITVLIYLFFPTCQNLRPEAFVRNNLLTRFIELFYSFDTNTNVCPSLHVIGSVAAMFGLWDCKALQSVGWKIAATSIAVCISLSTVFMKQHSIMDVLAALPVCFFGWWIAYKILPNNKTNRFLTRM